MSSIQQPAQPATRHDPQTTAATEAQRQQAQRAGWTAKEIGQSARHCPYAEGDPRRDVWLAAHAAATTITSDELIQGADAMDSMDAVIERVRQSRAANGVTTKGVA